MVATVGYLVIDARETEKVAEFWCALLDMEQSATVGDAEFVVLTPRNGVLSLVVQRVDEPKSGKNRLHLDLSVEDLDAATAAVASMGGRWIEPGLTHELDGYRWRTMEDPEGNEFDLQMAPAD